MSNNFARLGTYLRFLGRRERMISFLWIVCIAGASTMFAALYPGLFPNRAELVQMAVTMSNPAMVAMMGRVYGMSHMTQAIAMSQECLVWFLITIAIMNIFLVNRHTRADEESGRLEMFRALPVGRLTGTLATIQFAFAVNLMISLLTAGLLLVLNIGGTTVEGAFIYGFSIGAAGFTFAALTLLLAQVFSTAHGVTGSSFALLGLFYILRALGDVKNNALSCISPLGLALKTEAFYTNDPIPLVILFAEGIVLCAAALEVCAVRDHGAGIIPAKKGRPHASRFLRSTFGFAWRLSKGSLVGWGAGMLLLGASYGSVCSDINSFVEDNEMMKKILETGGANTLLDSYTAMIFIIMSMLSSIPVILTALKIHGEERHGRLEQILALAVPRTKLYTNFIFVAVLESLIMQLLLSLGLGLASGGDLSIGPLVKIGLSYLPAIWVMGGLAVLLTGFLPRFTALIWVVFGYTFIAMYMGRVLDLPKWASKITPFGNIPEQPVEEFTIVPLIILTFIAVLFTILGIRGFKTRDIE